MSLANEQTPAYLLGRLVAALEAENRRIAVKRVVDNPSRILSPILKKRAKEDVDVGMTSPASILSAMFARLSPPHQLTSRTEPLSPEQAAQFFKGYKSQREKFPSPQTPLSSEELEPLSERFEMKLTPTQKIWLLGHGGAELLRAFIDNEMLTAVVVDESAENTLGAHTQ